jgi:hypothetical protein
MNTYIISVKGDGRYTSDSFKINPIVITVIDEIFTELDERLRFFTMSTLEEFQTLKEEKKDGYYFYCNKDIGDMGGNSFYVTVKCQKVEPEIDMCERFYYNLTDRMQEENYKQIDGKYYLKI